jgi:hypothetical protein
MGGLDGPLARVLKALKWRLEIVPFFFRVVRPARFLTRFQMLRSSAARRVLSSAAAYTGAGWAGIHLIQATRNRVRTAGVSAEMVSEWGPWVDEIWEAAAPGFTFAAVRNAGVLREFLPLKPESRISACRVDSGGRVAGWAALMTREMLDHPVFGNLHVGTVLDVMARPGFEETVVAAASKVFARTGIDLLLTNQWHPVWRCAFDRSGYFTGPSKHVVGFSPELASAIGDDFSRVHITRADSDGRVNL